MKAEQDIAFLQERIRYLEEVNRFTLDALEMAASVGDFQSSINKLQDVSVILEETRLRVQRLICFQAVGFLIVDESTSEFALASAEPKRYWTFIQEEVDFLVESGAFAWALREKRPIVLPSKGHDKNLVIHVMATSSRVRGMFVGVLERDKTDTPDISLALLSIIMLSSSNALESFELYSMIREINKSLEKKENYKLLFEAAPDGVEVLDARGNIVDCNNTFQTLVGCAREEIVGKHTTDFFAEAAKALFENMLSSLRLRGYFEGEMELAGCDGRIIPVWRKEKAIYDESSNFVGSVVYNHDLSEVRRAEAEKANLRAQLERAKKMEAIGTLAGGVAHDLNNILGGIVSYPELLLMKLPPDSPLRKPIATIQKSGEKAAAIVQDLLTLARRGVSVTEVVNLNDTLSEYFKSPEYRKLEEVHPNVRIRVRLEEDLLNMMGSPVHLSKTLMNLVSNAVEAIAGEGTVTVSTSNEYIESPSGDYDKVEGGDYVALTVADTGTGIPAADIEQIFEPFYTRKVMGRSGTGLGLAVVWGTVKDHGGYIDVQSTEGKGTTFRLYFPVIKEERPREKLRAACETYCGRGEKILVVDDMEEQREVACQILSSLGYDITAARSGEEAVAYMEHNSADLLILDMIMSPGMDGLDTYKAILSRHPRQKALLVSGYSETERVREAQRLGAGAYIRKPFLLETLGMAIRAELGESEYRTHYQACAPGS